MTDDEIIQTAHLLHDAIDEDRATMEKATQALDRVNGPVDLMLIWLAGKMIKGQPYRIVDDNPQTISCARSIAQRLGGVVTSIETDGRRTSIRFDPPARQ